MGIQQLDIRPPTPLDQACQPRRLFDAPAYTIDDFERALRRVVLDILPGRFNSSSPVTPESIKRDRPTVTKSAPKKRRPKLCPQCHKVPLTGKKQVCGDACRQAKKRAKDKAKRKQKARG